MKTAQRSKLVKARRKIYVVEDHPIFRKGLIQMLKGEKNLKVCGAAATADKAFAAIARTRPDLVLVDISLPGRSGLELIKEVRLANRTVRMLVISMHDEALYAERVLRAGGDGYVMKQEDPEEILQAIRDVLEGHIYVSEEVLEGPPKGRQGRKESKDIGLLNTLSDTELELLEQLGKGKSSLQIARQLRMAESAVLSSLVEIRQKLKLRSALALLRYAVSWVESERV
jgi:DNA-binding NarL/FixJ family response regulator